MGALVRRYALVLIASSLAVTLIGVFWMAVLSHPVPAWFIAVPVAVAGFLTGRAAPLLMGRDLVGRAAWGTSLLCFGVTTILYGALLVGALLTHGMTISVPPAFLPPLVVFAVLFLSLIRVAIWFGVRRAGIG